MKSISIIVLLILGMSFITWNMVSCNSKKTTAEYTKHPPDTTKTIVSFISPRTWERVGITRQGYTVEISRATKDTFAIDSVDVNAMRRIWKRDTSYYTILSIPILDSTGKNVLDSLKRPKMNTLHADIPRENIIKDLNINPE